MGTFDDVALIVIGGLAFYIVVKTCTLQNAANNINVPEISAIVSEIGNVMGAACATGGGGGGGIPGGGGSTATGQHIYQTTGGTCSCGDGSQTIGCGGSDVHSERQDCDNCGLKNYEATAIIDFSPSSCGCGDEFDVKLGGPNHSDGSCCWWAFVVNENGSGGITTGGEGPHPDTDKKSKDGVVLDSIGDIKGKKIGIKGITWDNGNGTRHFEGWVDRTGTGTSWELGASQDLSEWGKSKKTGTIPSNQQVEFRCDCEGVSWVASDVVEIVPGQKSSSSVGGPPAANFVRTRTSVAAPVTVRRSFGNRSKIRNYDALRFKSVIPVPPMVFR